MLNDQGYKVHPAPSGELALKSCRSTLPDLILLDIRMSGMDGYEVCRRLKASETFSITHEWCADGVESYIDVREKLLISEFPWMTSRILNGRVVAASSREDLPPGASSFRFLFERGRVRSIIFVPIFHGEVVMGAVGVDSARRERCKSHRPGEALSNFRG